MGKPGGHGSRNEFTVTSPTPRLYGEGEPSAALSQRTVLPFPGIFSPDDAKRAALILGDAVSMQVPTGLYPMPWRDVALIISAIFVPWFAIVKLPHLIVALLAGGTFH